MKKMNKTVFVSTPITGFDDMQEFLIFKERAVFIIAVLKNLGYFVYNEFEKVEDESCFDSPSKSVDDDFNKITNSDYFIFVHPRKMQTSSFIELGYACALQKPIIIISKYGNLPFLAKGLCESRLSARFIEFDEKNNVIENRLKQLLSENK